MSARLHALPSRVALAKWRIMLPAELDEVLEYDTESGTTVRERDTLQRIEALRDRA